jgi:Protein of unknown function (DUF2934)
MSDSLQRTSIELTQKLAYENWVRRGCPFGSPEVDWFAAEKQFAENQGSTQESKDELYEYSFEPTET